MIPGWQIIRTLENSSEEFVMIYDLYIEQTDPEEEDEYEANNKRHSSNILSDGKGKEAIDVFEE